MTSVGFVGAMVVWEHTGPCARKDRDTSAAGHVSLKMPRSANPNRTRLLYSTSISVEREYVSSCELGVDYFPQPGL